MDLVFELRPTWGRYVKAIIVNVHEAKTLLSRLLDRSHAGQEIILVKAGKVFGTRPLW